MKNLESLKNKIAEKLNRPLGKVRAESCSGGCINQAFVLYEDDSPLFFVKENKSHLTGMFQAEMAGLLALNCDTGPRIPTPFAVEEVNDHQFLLMEYIPQGVRKNGFWISLGRSLANLHIQQTSDSCGFPTNNYIGATPQENDRNPDWPQFFAEKRLFFQLKLAQSKNRASAKITKGVEKICNAPDKYIPSLDKSSLLHGDLWGGNIMCDTDHQPVLIDPAVYYGAPEADLAMTELFGGFHRDFYSAYQEVLPVHPEYPQLKKLYNLYHILNHLNLFGNTYAYQAESLLREIL